MATTSNRNLTVDELLLARTLLTSIREHLESLSGGDSELLFAYRRKIYKELIYDERSKPADRKKLKALKRREQAGLCLLCREPLPATYAVLDRIRAVDGYTAANTRLLCPSCDTAVQASRGYA